MFRFFLTVCLMTLVAAPQAEAAVRTETVLYRHDGQELEGYLAYDDATEDRRPGVLVVHEWKGLNEYSKKRAEQLAALGYVALAADMYGKGVRPQSHEEAAKVSGALKSDRQLMRGRGAAALEVLGAHPLADPSRLAAIGYCFGGSAVLELARSGAELKGVASFHGPLDTPDLADAKNIKAKVRVFTGAADPHIGPESVLAFEKEMADAGVDSKVTSYPGVVHSFTVPTAGNDPSTGAAYDEAADLDSWQKLQEFFGEIFA